MASRDYRSLLRQMEHDMQRFAEEAFSGFFDAPHGLSRFWQPATDVLETESGLQVKMELAGVGAEHLSVSLSADGRRLTVGGVRGERSEERGERTRCHQLEIYFGPFERTIPLPPEIEVDRDAISATLRDGFLTITLPRRERQPVRSRSIPIAVQE